MIYTIVAAFLVLCGAAAAATPLLFRLYVVVARRTTVEVLPQDQTISYPFV